MKGYAYACYWIAVNDEPTIINPEDMQYDISVMLIADMWGKDKLTVAWDVCSIRTHSISRTLSIALNKIGINISHERIIIK